MYFALRNKTQSTDAIERAINAIERMGFNPQTIRSDGELFDNKRTKARIEKKGIIIESSAPYAAARNGLAERSGGVIAARARAMRIDAKLPENLWPEILAASVHIGNRTPTRAIDYKESRAPPTKSKRQRAYNPKSEHDRPTRCEACEILGACLMSDTNSLQACVPVSRTLHSVSVCRALTWDYRLADAWILLVVPSIG